MYVLNDFFKTGKTKITNGHPYRTRTRHLLHHSQTDYPVIISKVFEDLILKGK
jgi:hypothetical protein